ncbi:hypothetical protein BKA70DRAFT_228135 [Coprinopsis sp. MPI-PUGE-AT-0042]|nr:hypothetical protein BKA70DRAFT_228135 [Coprinopsis sp. MPI-PUGE-AT-0042]
MALALLRFSDCVISPTVILLFYDYLLTLDMEAQLIWNWKTRCPGISGLYLLVRYMVFIDAVFILLYATARDNCGLPYYLLGWWAMAGIMIAEILLTVQVCAAWNKDKKVICIAGILFSLVWGTVLCWMNRFQAAADWSSELEGKICVNIGSTTGIRVIWCGIAVYDCILLILLAIPAWGFCRPRMVASNTPNISTVFFANGIGFYVLFIVLAIVNASLPGTFIQILSVVHRLCVSLLTCRTILHVRQESSAQYDQSLPALPPMEFVCGPASSAENMPV